MEINNVTKMTYWYHVCCNAAEYLVESEAAPDSVIPGVVFEARAIYRYNKILQNTPHGLSKTELVIPQGPVSKNTKVKLIADIVCWFGDMVERDRVYIEDMIKNAKSMMLQEEEQRMSRNSGIVLPSINPNSFRGQ